MLLSLLNLKFTTYIIVGGFHRLKYQINQSSTCTCMPTLLLALLSFALLHLGLLSLALL